MKKNHKLCSGPSNKHSYQDWFQLAQWFQRRKLKCKSIWMTTNDDKGGKFDPDILGQNNMCVLGFNSKNKSRSIGFFPFKAHLTQRVK
jgi:hypothetical protein